jgi:Papain family cysteine protease
MPKKIRARTELRRICNLVPSRGTQTDWKFENALQAGALGSVTALPLSKDLRQPWWKIGDQGGTGSCVGWASTDGLMRYQLVGAGKLAQNERVSPRYTWMASKEIDEFNTRPETFIEEAGTSLKAAVDICRKYGVVLESLLPFQIGTLMYVGNESQLYAAAAQRRATAYFNLGKSPAQWRAWLASNRPILAGLAVDATWDQAATTHGIVDTFQPNTVRGGHAVCVVGYRKDNRFIVRNSWGTGFGDQGFAYVSEAYIAAGFFAESYGISI